MKALVTGGAGFIGSHLADGLLAVGPGASGAHAPIQSWQARSARHSEARRAFRPIILTSINTLGEPG
jgi:nucleoside-diphosphate-sugar epimerase